MINLGTANLGKSLRSDAAECRVSCVVANR